MLNMHPSVNSCRQAICPLVNLCHWRLPGSGYTCRMQCSLGHSAVYYWMQYNLSIHNRWQYYRESWQDCGSWSLYSTEQPSVCCTPDIAPGGFAVVISCLTVTHKSTSLYIHLTVQMNIRNTQFKANIQHHENCVITNCQMQKLF